MILGQQRGLVMPEMANLRSAPLVKVPAVIVKVSTPPAMVLVPALPAPPVTKERVPGETTASPAALSVIMILPSVGIGEAGGPSYGAVEGDEEANDNAQHSRNGSASTLTVFQHFHCQTIIAAGDGGTGGQHLRVADRQVSSGSGTYNGQRCCCQCASRRQGGSF